MAIQQVQSAAMLAPAAVLVMWSLIVLLWVALSRFPAMAKLGASVKSAPAGARGQDLDGVLPARINWKSHNYTHLMEQPTIFYPTVVILALMGASDRDVFLAWGYVAIRIVHSIWQATVNTIPIRFALFAISTLCLVALAFHAIELTVFARGTL